MSQIPKAYKKGFIDFLNCKISLSNKVLIPRPETEYWTKKLIQEIKKKKERIKILDIFSGSGCIGIAICKNIEDLCLEIHFSEKEEGAIKQIKKNLKINKIPKEKYKVLHSSFFDKVKDSYNLIVANPPYVAKRRIKEVGKSVLDYEPHQALFSGEEGLDHIKKFLKEAMNFLQKDGIIYLEFDPQQKGRIKKMIKEKYSQFTFFKDQFNKYRFVKIKK
jgi:release factor glutamine methyltransferase